MKALAENAQLSTILPLETRENFAELAVDGAALPLQDAISLLIDGYIDNCGISKSMRTAYYDAGSALFDIFMFTHSPLAALLRSKEIDCLYDCMEMFNNSYIRADYDKYDITVLDDSDYLELCMEECASMPEAKKKALCYGIFSLLFENKKQLSNHPKFNCI